MMAGHANLPRRTHSSTKTTNIQNTKPNAGVNSSIS